MILYEEQLALGEIVKGRRCQFWGPRLHILQPLFEALLIILCSQDHDDENSTTVGSLPVFLVRTGNEDGLGAPIEFETIADKIDGYVAGGRGVIKTTLESAFDFVMSLEAREAAAFGLHPDPAAACSLTWGMGGPPDTVREIAREELFIGPSSKFVDTEKYPEWRGGSEVLDYRMVANTERIAFQKAEELAAIGFI
ncbi:hypothetical protein GGR53DRAFT_468432 [Hypoxylon sp. FL1150]|nr:hypothetical protein GGR53DRAFT_468432 [Hypoxylon sp. FL1150]